MGEVFRGAVSGKVYADHHTTSGFEILNPSGFPPQRRVVLDAMAVDQQDREGRMTYETRSWFISPWSVRCTCEMGPAFTGRAVCRGRRAPS